MPYAYCPTCDIKTLSTPSVSVCGATDTTTTNLSEVCGSDTFTPKQVKLVEAVETALRSGKIKKTIAEETEAEEIEVEEAVSEESALSETQSKTEQVDTTCIEEGIIETKKNGESKRLLTCDEGHLLAIGTEFVSSALKEFLERYEFVKKEETTKRTVKEKLTVSRNITDEDITAFWERYRYIFSEDRERLWDNLLVGLKKYYEVLKERSQLNAETELLRKQNAEMRRLLSRSATEVI